MIGVHTVTLYPDPGSPAGAVDISCLLDDVAINHGRDDTASQPEASSATLNLSADTTDTTFPDVLEIGAAIVVATTVAGIESTRFAGRVTDVSLGWEESGDDTPNTLIGQVTAVGSLADLGARVVGDVPWPQELDGARVAAVLAAAGVILDPVTSDPGTVQILARDVDSQPALTVAQSVATDAGGILWETRAGEIRYADANHRRKTLPGLELDSCDVLVSPTWRRTTEGMINAVSIGYGTVPAGGEQPRYVAERDPYRNTGIRGFTTETQLAELNDAAAMGNLLLTRNHTPVWIMSALPVDVAGLDVDRTGELLELDLHDLVALTGLPVAGTAPTNTSLWIEGWTERIAFGEHEIGLLVSGYCRTVPAPQWDDTPPGWTWDTLPPAMTWDDMTCLGPQPSLGRWSDVPASLRWDQVDPATTWDNWTN